MKNLSADKQGELLFKMANDVDLTLSPSELQRNPRAPKLNEWYSRAAELGHPDAVSRRGEYFEFEKNSKEEAVELYKMSSERSPASEGALNLARFFADNGDIANAKKIWENWQQTHSHSKTLKEIHLSKDVLIRINFSPAVFIENLAAAKDFLRFSRTHKGMAPQAPKTAEYKEKLRLAINEIPADGSIIDPASDAAFILDEAADMEEYINQNFEKARSYRLRAQELSPTFSGKRFQKLEGISASNPAEEYLSNQKNWQRGAAEAYKNAAAIAKHDGDFDKYLECILKASETGDMEAVIMLGYAHIYGIGTPTDISKAKEIFLKCSADPKFPEDLSQIAIKKLAEIYLSQDDEKNAKEICANSGKTTYLQTASEYYLRNKEYEKSYALLNELCKISTNIDSQMRLAEMTLYGVGVDADPQKACKLYLDALKMRGLGWTKARIAIIGIIDACEQAGNNELAETYRKNIDGKTEIGYFRGFYTSNFDIPLLLNYAKRGDIYAMNILGTYCLNVKKDPARARAWFNSAGSDFEMSKMLPEKISKEDIALSEKLVWEIFDSAESAVGGNKE